MNISRLATILKLLDDAGYGHEDTCAEHDVIYLLPDDEVSEDSELGQKLIEAGAHLVDEGWQVFT